MLQIKKAKGGYIVYLKAGNGEILMTSEILKTEANAINNVVSSMINAFKFSLVFTSDIKKAKKLYPNLWNGETEKQALILAVKYFKRLKNKSASKNKLVKKVSDTSKAKEKLKAETKTLVPSKKAPKTKPSVKVTIKKNK